MSLQQNSKSVFEMEQVHNQVMNQIKKSNLTDLDIAIYLRVSSDEQAEKELGILGQKLSCEDFIQKSFAGKTYNIYIYKDEGYSADKYLLHERPEMNKLIKDCQAGKISHIVVFRGDRIARKSEDDSWFRNTTKLLGVPVFTSNDGQQYNDASAQNMFLRGMMALIAEYEIAVTKERILATKAYQKKEKLFSGGDIPYGYSWVTTDENGKVLDKNEKYIKKNDNEIEVYKMMKEMYLIENLGTTAIANVLNQKGYRNANGNKFNRDNVRQILRNPFYAGFFPTNVIVRGRDVNGKKYVKRNPIEEWELIESHLIPKIMEKSEWEEIIEKMEGRRTTEMKPKEVSTDWLLSGLIKCSCGETWTIRDSGKRKNGKHYKYYCCKNKDCDRDVKSLIKDEIENKILTRFKEDIILQLTEDDLLPKANEQIKKSMSSMSVNINEVQVKINKLKRDLKKIEDSFLDEYGNPTPSEAFESLWNKTKKELQLETENLDRLIEEKQLKANEEEYLNLTLNAIQMLFSAIHVSEKFNQTQKRVMLLTFIESMNIDEHENIFIKYREDMNDIPVHLKSKIKVDINESLNEVFKEASNELAVGLNIDEKDKSVNLLGNMGEQRPMLLHISQHQDFTKNAISLFFSNMNNRTSK